MPFDATVASVRVERGGAGLCTMCQLDAKK